VIDPRNVIALFWAVWALSWFAAAFWNKPAQARASLAEEASYRLTLILGFVAAFISFGLHEPPKIEWPAALQWLFVLISAGGFGVCWWARLQLGTLWSATITRKADHHIIESGPYAYVRHPIYTGLLISLLAAALVQATFIAALGFAVVAIGFFQKARLEEGFLKRELGEAAYDAYAARVPMLVPFLRLRTLA
jgi:protein-S-isoprenylcysteine O-methyltransferase Ste14